MFLDPQNFYSSNTFSSGRFSRSSLPPDKDAFQIEAEELQTAAQTLCSRISALIGEEDRAQLRLLNEAILRGDLSAFEQICRSERHNIGRLRALIQTIDKTFVDCQSGLRVMLCSDGTVLLHRYHGGAGLQIFLSETPSELRPIKTEWDGTVCLTEGEVIGVEPEDLLAEISMMAVKRIMNTLSADPTTDMTDLPTVYEVGEPD